MYNTKAFKYAMLNNKNMSYKQVIIVRQDLKLPKGKMAVQVAHASSSALIKSHKDDTKKWQTEGMKKVVLKVKDLDELLKYKQQAEDLGLITSLIEDAGKTVLNPGTVTCLGIGPDKEEKVDRVSGKLKML